jgi:hypothetical protein
MRIYFERVWNDAPLKRYWPDSWRGGSTVRARRSIGEFGSILTGGLVVGDLLWLLVIAFLFAVISGVVG